jgi:hypothetical protein
LRLLGLLDPECLIHLHLLLQLLLLGLLVLWLPLRQLCLLVLLDPECFQHLSKQSLSKHKVLQQLNTHLLFVLMVVLLVVVQMWHKIQVLKLQFRLHPLCLLRLLGLLGPLRLWVQQLCC